MSELQNVIALNDPMAEDEISYWRSSFHRFRRVGDGHIENLLNPDLPLQKQFVDCIESYRHPSSEIVRILDVGCGPLSTLGKRASFEVEVVGIDPLAAQYSALLMECGVISPHRSVAGLGEELLQLFDKESFDFVHSRNALDHCNDPRIVISNMLKVAKPGAKIFINVCQNEAENAAYSGFHRWNFDDFHGRIIIWNPGNVVFLDQVIDGLPYEFDRTLFSAGRKFPDQLSITIHNVVLDRNAVQTIRGGISAEFSRKHGYVIVEIAPDADWSSGHSFFLHCFVNDNLTYSTTFRWYAHNLKRSFKIDANKYTSVRFGQYSSSGEGEHIKYENLWSNTLYSIE
jgi:SAM-dependent methyltransferase